MRPKALWVRCLSPVGDDNGNKLAQGLLCQLLRIVSLDPAILPTRNVITLDAVEARKGPETNPGSHSHPSPKQPLICFLSLELSLF